MNNLRISIQIVYQPLNLNSEYLPVAGNCLSLSHAFVLPLGGVDHTSHENITHGDCRVLERKSEVNVEVNDLLRCLLSGNSQDFQFEQSRGNHNRCPQVRVVET